jgi:hypothetical protein
MYCEKYLWGVDIAFTESYLVIYVKKSHEHSVNLARPPAKIQNWQIKLLNVTSWANMIYSLLNNWMIEFLHGIDVLFPLNKFF